MPLFMSYYRHVLFAYLSGENKGYFIVPSYRQRTHCVTGWFTLFLSVSCVSATDGSGPASELTGADEAPKEGKDDSLQSCSLKKKQKKSKKHKSKKKKRSRHMDEDNSSSESDSESKHRKR